MNENNIKSNNAQNKKAKNQNQIEIEDFVEINSSNVSEDV